MVIFLVLGAQHYTPGVKIELPIADNLPGSDKIPITVALDENGYYYYKSQIIDEAKLKAQFTNAVSTSTEPLILVIQADRAVRAERILRLQLLARDAGISEALWATQPRASVFPARQ